MSACVCVEIIFIKGKVENNILFKLCTVGQERIRMACLHAVLTQRKNHHSSSIVMKGALGMGSGCHF